MCTHFAEQITISLPKKNISPIDFNMKGQEALITELGQVFTALNKLECVWTDSRNESSQLWNLEGINEKGSAIVVVSAMTFSEKKPYMQWVQLYIISSCLLQPRPYT